MAERTPEGARHEVEVLSAPFRCWVVDNLLNGASACEVVAGLVEQGVPAPLAAREVDELAKASVLSVCAELTVQKRRRDQVLRLLREHRKIPARKAVRRVEAIAPSALLEGPITLSEPVVIEQGARSWPAMKRWSFESFAARFGQIEVDACIGREADPQCNQNFATHTKRMLMKDLLATIMGSPMTNDVYAIANNRLMHEPGLRELFDDVTVDPALIPNVAPGNTSLWIGPGGTVTPMHHDSTNIYFAQIVGSKRFHLVSPFETELLDSLQGFYAAADIESPEWKARFGRVAVTETTLEPGDVLLLPAGWWHRAESLSPSISFSLMGFGFRNTYPWFEPGNTRVGSTFKEGSGPT